MESILTSIKGLLGIAEEYDHFDPVIITHINSTFMILNQLGVGPAYCFRIEGEAATWSDFLGENNTNFEAVKTYVYYKVRLMFDPPEGAAKEAAIRVSDELEWRLNLAAETRDT